MRVPPIHRPFSTSPCLGKKGGKAAREAAREAARIEEQQDDDDDGDPGQILDEPPSEDPYDLTALTADVDKALADVKNSLSKLTGGGRFNHEVLENLKVELDKNSKQRARLSDVAQVVPRGRTVQILVGEKEVSLSLHLVQETVGRRVFTVV